MRTAFLVLLASVLPLTILAQDRLDKGSFERRMSMPLEVTWSNAPARRSLLRLGDAQGVPVFVDRRIDPSRPLSIQIHAATVRQGLLELAGQFDWQVSELGNLVYIGPRPSTGKIATIVEINRGRLKKLPAKERRIWQSRKAVNWPRLSEPRRLLSKWATEAGATVRNAESIPHDLWDAGGLPAMTLLERMTVLLAGFDLAISIDADGTARIVRIPERVVLTRSYPLRPSQIDRLDEIRDLADTADLDVSGNRLTLVAPSEIHRRVRRWLDGRRVTKPNDAPVRRRYSLSVENQPFEGVIRSLCEQLKIEPDLEGVSESKRRQLISLRVENVTETELLKLTVSKAGLKHRRDDGKLLITQP